MFCSIAVYEAILKKSHPLLLIKTGTVSNRQVIIRNDFLAPHHRALEFPRRSLALELLLDPLDPLDPLDDTLLPERLLPELRRRCLDELKPEPSILEDPSLVECFIDSLLLLSS